MTELYCRVCALDITDQRTMPLFGNNKAYDLRTRVMECASISIEDGDGLPRNVCLTCKSKLNAAFRFRILCQRNDTLFRQKLLSGEHETSGIDEHMLSVQDIKVEPIVKLETCDNEITFSNHDATMQGNQDSDEESFHVLVQEIDNESLAENTDSSIAFLQTDVNKRRRSKLKHNRKKCARTNPIVSQAGQKDKPRPKRICDTCGAAVISLTKHKLTHEKIKFSCQLCDKHYTSPNILHRHLKTHNPDKPLLCPHCPLRFHFNQYLQRHLLVHTGERPYPCHLCTKAFQTPYNLRTHIRSHTRERIYKCDYCEERFIHRSVLNIHMRKHKEHLEVPESHHDQLENEVYL